MTANSMKAKRNSRGASRSRPSGGEPATAVKIPRGVPAQTAIRLAAASAGRCEFCNNPLFWHPFTQQDGNFAEKAHIYPFSSGGPRGGGKRPAAIHTFENLMFLCAACHKLVDDKKNEALYSIDALRKRKAEHEARIAEITAAGPELRTTVLQVKGVIGGQHVDIPAAQVREAVAPRYVTDQTGYVIDLTGAATESPESFELARREIRRRLSEFLRGGIDGLKARHFSVFALAPIPVLVCLGREIGDKLAVDLYQRHRDNQSWTWKADGDPVEYDVERLQVGTDPTAVALVLSLSGAISRGSLPAAIDGAYSIYEMTLKGREPDREFLRRRDDLTRFQRAYQLALGAILKDHESLRQIHLFPAVPAPVAIACGRELLPKVHPALLVYDNDGGNFRFAIAVNRGEDL